MVDYQNQFKKFIFKKDIFSNSKNIYKRKKNLKIEEILKFFGKYSKLQSKIYVPKNNVSKNSSNFLVIFKKKKFLLKKESIKKETLNEKIIRFNEFKKIKRKRSFIFPLGRNKKILNKDDYIWSLYNFFDGDLFSGKKNQLKIVSKKSSEIQTEVKNLKLKRKSFNYFTKEECKIVKKYENNTKLWNDVLGKKNKINYLYLKYFLSEWNNLKKLNMKIKKLKKQICHFDLHPHNIMIKKNKIKIIDLTSLKFMPIEIGIAFSGVKLCRQTYNNNKNKIPIELGKIFINNLDKKLKKKLNKSIFVNDFANIEILRRICVILKNNFYGNKSYNFILPALLSNIVESKIIFKNMHY